MAQLPMAVDYPFLNILWSMLVFVGFVFWIWLAITVFMDVFRRRDMGGFVKALWIIFVIFIPLLGVLLYLIVYHKSMADRNVKQVEAAQAAFDQQVREAAGKSGPATEIATAKTLLDAGAITEAEYEDLKRKALAGQS
ncbi:MAG: SHOCT domain-containing protein [Solirubrobacteraceae bacterium]